MARKLAEWGDDIEADSGQEEYYKDSSEHWRLYQRIKENILSKKLQPFVSKRIVEYLGVQEYELVSFGIDHLRNKKSAEDLTKGMMMTLDEESELFVKKEIMAYVNF
ncbi:unnamed protein product [Rhizophagus irregularis]|nr:unnamed protein product [Rhizophagus irregularis]